MSSTETLPTRMVGKERDNNSIERQAVIDRMARDMARISRNRTDGAITYKDLLDSGWDQKEIQEYGLAARDQLNTVLHEAAPRTLTPGKGLGKKTSPAISTGEQTIIRELAQSTVRYSVICFNTGEQLKKTIKEPGILALDRIDDLINKINVEARAFESMAKATALRIADLKARENQGGAPS